MHCFYCRDDPRKWKAEQGSSYRSGKNHGKGYEIEILPTASGGKKRRPEKNYAHQDTGASDSSHPFFLYF
jgi:hypothetical protein